MPTAALTTEQLLLTARITVGTKRTIAAADLLDWLELLASAGILERDGDGWRPTRLGARWLAPIRNAFPSDEQELAA